MGDRTYVTLTVRRADKDRVLQICDTADYAPETPDQDPNDVNFVHMGFEDVNYGELPFLPALEKAGIPFESSWASGDEYGEGTSYCRYNDEGDHVPYVLYEENYLVPIHELMKRLHDYNSLAEFIREKDQGLQIIPWDNQERNAKLFLTKQLINPE